VSWAVEQLLCCHEEHSRSCPMECNAKRGLRHQADNTRSNNMLAIITTVVQHATVSNSCRFAWTYRFNTQHRTNHYTPHTAPNTSLITMHHTAQHSPTEHGNTNHYVPHPTYIDALTAAYHTNTQPIVLATTYHSQPHVLSMLSPMSHNWHFDSILTSMQIPIDSNDSAHMGPCSGPCSHPRLHPCSRKPVP
jgi:hypothetical protein